MQIEINVMLVKTKEIRKRYSEYLNDVKKSNI